jgi:hypothetical protein
MMVTPRPLRPGAKIKFIYYHQRMRLQGFGIDWSMDAAGINSPVPAMQAVPAANASFEESQR